MDSHPRWAPPSDAHTALSRQQAHLQSHLQELLDAQSEGLLTGFSGGERPQDESSSTGTATPTSTARNSAWRQDSERVVPVRQPQPRKIGLRGARRGISRSITELATLKNEEVQILEDELGKRTDVLATVHQLASKEADLQKQVRSIEAEDDSSRLEQMRQEEGNLNREIYEFESKLYEMKAKHRMLKRQIEETENVVQAKLSSYKNSLELTRREMREFLARPPVGLEHKKGTVGTEVGRLWSLPRDRRTLEMAAENYKSEEGQLREQVAHAEKEKEALAQGAQVWNDVVREVTAVEEVLRREMQNLQQAEVGNLLGGQVGREAGMQRILESMNQARAKLDDKLSLAEQNGWKLLVCCIGAEVEALNEGHDVLERTFSSVLESKHKGRRGSFDEKNGDFHRDTPRTKDNPEFWAVETGHGGLIASEEEDEGPGPELLISPNEDI